MENIYLSEDIVSHIHYMLELLDVYSDTWLYRKDLYKGTDDEVRFKVKALIYASHPEHQLKASRQITWFDFIKNGKMISAKEMEDILKNIKIEEDDFPDANY